jgi:hypothetical protein
MITKAIIGSLLSVQACVDFDCKLIEKKSSKCTLEYRASGTPVFGKVAGYAKLNDSHWFDMQWFQVGRKLGFHGERSMKTLSVFAEKFSDTYTHIFAYYSEYETKQKYTKYTCKFSAKTSSLK